MASIKNEIELINQFDDLDQESKYLAHKAKDAAGHAHAPYSRFTVGAALILDDGTVVTGFNYENAAHPSGMCAERVALYAATAQHPGRRIMKLVVVAKRKGGKELVPATCCGSCRQVILEFETNQSKPIEVVMQGDNHVWIKAPSAVSLLPFAFTREHLDTHNHKP